MLGGVALAAVVVCAYALLTKVFPGQLDANDVYARLRAPYGYWNAIGLTAAMGVICCLWLGARRAGHALLSALAYPAMGLMLVTLLLAYSRGALVALAIGLALWFCIVPLRLRGAAVLVAGGLGAGAVVAWDFSRPALSTEGVALAERVTAGPSARRAARRDARPAHARGAGGRLSDRSAAHPRAVLRRRAGIALLALARCRVIAFVGALAVSHRGLTGSISHAFNSLTNPNAKVPNTPGRLTAVASVRARYWKEALKVFEAHPLLGAGRGRLSDGAPALPHRADRSQTRPRLHRADARRSRPRRPRARARAARRLDGRRRARDAPVQPAMDAAGARWRGVARAARPGWRRWTISARPAPYTPERIGMLSMLCLVVVFGDPLARRLDLVRAGRCLRGAALRRLARGPRAAGLGRSRRALRDPAHAAAGDGRSVTLPAGAPQPDGAADRPARAPGARDGLRCAG